MSKIDDLIKNLHDIKKALAKASSEETHPEIPKVCTTCKKGVPKVKAKTDLGDKKATWWDCPNCRTTGLSLHGEEYSEDMDKSELHKWNNNGQWSLDKSNEIKPTINGQKVNTYDTTANINRKSTRTGEEVPGVGKNVGVRQYTTSNASVQQAHEAAQAAEQKIKTQASTRTFADMSEDEKAQMKAKYEKPALKKGIDVVSEALTTGYLPTMGEIPIQPSDAQLFGHLVKSEEEIKKADEKWQSGNKEGLREASKPIDHLNKTTIKSDWGYGKSFNSIIKDELTKEELAERNSFVGHE